MGTTKGRPATVAFCRHSSTSPESGGDAVPHCSKAVAGVSRKSMPLTLHGGAGSSSVDGVPAGLPPQLDTSRSKASFAGDRTVLRMTRPMAAVAAVHCVS